jgi:hypothetical protein
MFMACFLLFDMHHTFERRRSMQQAAIKKIMSLDRQNPDLINAYLTHIYKYIRRYKYFDADDCHDFILYFYPTLIKALQNFRDMGKPFEYYLSFLITRRVKTFLKRKLHSKELAHTSASLYALNGRLYTESAEPEPEPDPRIKKILEINNKGKIDNQAARKRFLLYAVKRADDLTPEHVEMVAALTRCEEQWLRRIVFRFKSELESKQKRLSRYVRRKNSLFVQKIMLEKKIRRELNRENKIELRNELRKTNELFKEVLRRIRRLSMSPSHREMAGALSIPKGTIDTSLSRLKHLIKRV